MDWYFIKWYEEPVNQYQSQAIKGQLFNSKGTFSNSDELIGEINAWYGLRCPRGGYIDDLEIKKGYRRKGLGSRLAKEFLERYDIESCSLSADPWDDTTLAGVVKFYTKLGFRVTKVHKDPTCDMLFVRDQEIDSS